uniref:SP-RING-type domain-containing protein n=1 Tax=Rhabditophanes sp. KR3021 TaxID=114890 RepID=A0AC35U373_9BILA
MLRCFQINKGKECCDAVDTYPISLSLRINNKICSHLLPREVIYNSSDLKQRVNYPTNITTMVTINDILRFDPQGNKIIDMDLTYQYKKGFNDRSKFVFKVVLMTKKSIQEVARTVVERPRRSLDHFMLEVNKFMHSDEEIVLEKTKVSLKSSGTMERIKIPIRGINCNHLLIDDLEEYIEMNMMKEQWTCKICKASCRPEEIIIDEFYEKLLWANQSALEVELFNGGKYEVTSHKNASDDEEDEEDELDDLQKELGITKLIKNEPYQKGSQSNNGSHDDDTPSDEDGRRSGKRRKCESASTFATFTPPSSNQRVVANSMPLPTPNPHSLNIFNATSNNVNIANGSSNLNGSSSINNTNGIIPNSHRCNDQPSEFNHLQFNNVFPLNNVPHPSIAVSAYNNILPNDVIEFMKRPNNLVPISNEEQYQAPQQTPLSGGASFESNGNGQLSFNMQQSKSIQQPTQSFSPHSNIDLVSQLNHYQGTLDNHQHVSTPVFPPLSNQLNSHLSHMNNQNNAFGFDPLSYNQYLMNTYSQSQLNNTFQPTIPDPHQKTSLPNLKDTNIRMTAMHLRHDLKSNLPNRQLPKQNTATPLPFSVLSPTTPTMNQRPQDFSMYSNVGNNRHSVDLQNQNCYDPPTNFMGYVSSQMVSSNIPTSMAFTSTFPNFPGLNRMNWGLGTSNAISESSNNLVPQTSQPIFSVPPNSLPNNNLITSTTTIANLHQPTLQQTQALSYQQYINTQPHQQRYMGYE